MLPMLIFTQSNQMLKLASFCENLNVAIAEITSRRQKDLTKYLGAVGPDLEVPTSLTVHVSDFGERRAVIPQPRESNSGDVYIAHRTSPE